MRESPQRAVEGADDVSVVEEEELKGVEEPADEEEFARGCGPEEELERAEEEEFGRKPDEEAEDLLSNPLHA